MKAKTKILEVNTTSETPIVLHGRNLEEVEAFTYLVSIIDTKGGTDADVKVGIGKARRAYMQMRKSRAMSIHTKIRIFLSKVKSVLLYGAETENHEDHHWKRADIYLSTAV